MSFCIYRRFERSKSSVLTEKERRCGDKEEDWRLANTKRLRRLASVAAARFSSLSGLPPHDGVALGLLVVAT